MKKLSLCLTLVGLAACQSKPQDTFQMPLPPIALRTHHAPNLVTPVKPDDVLPGLFSLKHYLSLSDRGQAEVAQASARAGRQVSEKQLAANARLVETFDPLTLKISLGANGKYTLSMDYTLTERFVGRTGPSQTVTTSRLTIDTEGDILTRKLTAPATELGLVIELTCLDLAEDEICDPQKNALVAFKGLPGFPSFRDANFEFLFQSEVVTGQLNGAFTLNYPFASSLKGVLTVINPLVPNSSVAELVQLELTSSHGLMVFAATENQKEREKLEWTIDPTRSMDASIDSFNLGLAETSGGDRGGSFVLENRGYTIEFPTVHKSLDFEARRALF